MHVDAIQPVTFVVNQTVLAGQRPQHQAEHALVTARRRAGPGTKNTVAGVIKPPKSDIRTA
jgi:hypothetical protein